MFWMKEGKMLTPRQFASEIGVAYTTVMSWSQKGLIAEAVKQETLYGHLWEIPASVVGNFERPKMGRPSKKRAKPKRKVNKR